LAQEYCHCRSRDAGWQRPSFKLEIWGKAQRESAWRPKSNWGKYRGGEIPPVAKSRDPHSNALAYTKRALLT